MSRHMNRNRKEYSESLLPVHVTYRIAVIGEDGFPVADANASSGDLYLTESSERYRYDKWIYTGRSGDLWTKLGDVFMADNPDLLRSFRVENVKKYFEKRKKR